MENWVRARQRSSNNDWNTPKKIWDILLENKLIPKEKKIWCPFQIIEPHPLP